MKDSVMINLDEVIQTLKSIQALEKVIGELYGDCSRAFPEAGGLWSSLAAAEKRHAEMVGEMIQCVSTRPEDFKPGRSLKAIAIDTVVRGVERQRELLARNKGTLRQALFIARDLEQSILEKNYSDIVASSSSDYNALVNRMISDTEEHRGLLYAKITSTPD